jgi:predicted ferric reductase
MRLRGPALLALFGVIALVIVGATDQIVPATSEHQAELRIWLAARATGIVAYLLVTLQVVIGLVLSHPTNQSTWRLSKTLFPWHEGAWVFVLAFLAVHVVSLVLDPWAGVGIGGALIPGLSSYRSAPVALGTLALYAIVVTGLTARYTRLLPTGAWLTLHRIAIVVFGLAWLHGMLAGTDTRALYPMYLVTGLAVLAAATYRYWVTRRARPARHQGPIPAPSTEVSQP